jgi:hypothetical protein
LVRLSPGVTAILETKGYEDNKTRAKHDAAARWVTGANSWGELGRRLFVAANDPQTVPSLFDLVKH